MRRRLTWKRTRSREKKEGKKKLLLREKIHAGPWIVEESLRGLKTGK